MTDAATVRARRLWPVPALSTPAGLKMAMVVTAVAVAVFGLTASRMTIDRRAVAGDVVAEAAPSLLDAQQLYVSLAAADTAASTIFLRAGLEPPELRERYLTDLSLANERLATIAAADLGPSAGAATRTLAEQLPAYAGMVEAARTNSRLGFPVGAAYLRRASELMRTTMLPAATDVYEEAATRLGHRYGEGTAGSDTWTVGATAGLAIVVIGLAQLYVTSRSRRWLNAGLVVAAAVVVVGAVATASVLDRQRDALSRSRDDGAVLVTSLSTARILTLRSLSDENLDLIERGTEEEYVEDFDASIDILGVGPTGGLLDRAFDAAPDGAARRAVRALEDHYEAYLAAHREVRQLYTANDYPAAVAVAVGRQADAARAVDAEVADLIDSASATVAAEAGRAHDRATVLPLIIALAALGGVAAVVAGLQLRLREYR